MIWQIKTIIFYIISLVIEWKKRFLRDLYCYEKRQSDKVLLTNQMIEEFEEDIKEGKDISIEDYLKEEEDYSTRSSKLSLSISSKAEHIVDSAIKFIFKKLGSVVE